MRPCSMKEQRGDSGARDRRAEEEESREREVNIKVHSLKRLVTPLILLYLLTHHAIHTGSPTVCVCVSDRINVLQERTHSGNGHFANLR